MSGFKNPNFVMEFAYRTMINYYNLRLLQDIDSFESASIDASLEKIKKEMKNKGFVSSDFFEVTQLINSMIGLLVFPEQSYYRLLSNKQEDLEKEYPTLFKYVVGNRGDYRNTYFEDDEYSIPEKANPQNLIRHLRNSVAHRKISIFPVNGRLGDDTNIIKAVTFKDSRKRPIKFSDGTRKLGQEENFELTVDVKDFEQFLMEICKGIIKLVNGNC